LSWPANAGQLKFGTCIENSANKFPTFRGRYLGGPHLRRKSDLPLIVIARLVRAIQFLRRKQGNWIARIKRAMTKKESKTTSAKPSHLRAMTPGDFHGVSVVRLPGPGTAA
jgi:hypothetical protein